MAAYRFALQPRNGTPVAILDGITAASWSVPGNGIPDASATIDASASTTAGYLLRSGLTELIIYRDNVPLETVFQLTNIRTNGGVDGSTIEFAWQGIASYLQHMTAYADTVYTATAQSRIAWGLVNTFQGRTGGSYGLVDGGAPSTDPTRTITYEEDTDVAEAFQALADLDTGFDFHVDAARRVRFHYPSRGTDKSATVALKYGVNVVGYDYEVDTSPGRIITDVRVTGGPNATTTTASNSSARTAYGRREATIQASDVISSATALQNLANSIVATYDTPEILPSVQLAPGCPDPARFGTWWIGDTVRVDIQDDGIELVGNYRIASVSCSLDAEFTESITVELMPS